MTAISGIYKIQNEQNKKIYIGRSLNIQKRWYQHLGDLRNNNHHCKLLQKDWNFYRETAFSFSILEEAPFRLLKTLEKDYIKNYPADRLYNFSMTNHPWKQEISLSKIDFPVTFKTDSEGISLPLVFCPNCNLEKLINSFVDSSFYCLECRESLEAEIEIEDELLQGVRLTQYEKPIRKYLIEI